MRELIIDRPGLQTKRQRLLFGSMTLVFWALWIYLWLPVLALLGWALGFKIAYYEMVTKNGYVGVLQVLGWFITIIVCLGASLLVWAYYNYTRFHGNPRRRRVAPSTSPSLSERYGISPESLSRWQGERRLVLYHDADGKLIGTEPRR